MSGLELFAIAIIASVVYITVTAFSGVLVSHDYEEAIPIAWMTGCALFVVVILLWAKGEPFPAGR